MYTSAVLDEFSKLPTIPENGQTLVNQSDGFPASPQAIISFLQGSKIKCLIPYPKDNLEEEREAHKKEVYEVPQDRAIHPPSYSPILPYFPRVPTRIVGQATVNTQTKI